MGITSLPSRTASAVTLERFPVEFREYRHHLYRGVLCGILRLPDYGSKYSCGLDPGDQLPGGLSADCVGDRVERRKVRNRGVVIGCNKQISAKTVLASSICLFKTPTMTVASLCLAVICRGTSDTSRSAGDERGLARFDSRGDSAMSWLPVVVTSGSAAAWIKSRPLGTFARMSAFTTQREFRP